MEAIIRVLHLFLDVAMCMSEKDTWHTRLFTTHSLVRIPSKMKKWSMMKAIMIYMTPMMRVAAADCVMKTRMILPL
jgi:hypothetical protein